MKSLSKMLSFPSVPQGTWERTGFFPLLANVCFHYIPAAIESHSETVPRTVSRISVRSTKKRLQSEWTTGERSPLWHGVKGLIVIIGVQVGEVCVGVGLPGKLWVEVLVPFLQNQVVFVEGLQIIKKSKTYGEEKQKWIKGSQVLFFLAAHRSSDYSAQMAR